MKLSEDKLTWFATILPVPLDVNWQKEGDEWLHHMWAALGEKVTLEGHGMGPGQGWPEFPHAHIVLTPTSSELRSRLRIVLLERGLVAVVSGTDGPDINPAQVEPWAAAVEEASRRIGRRHKSFEWAAIIGNLPTMEIHDVALASETRVGPLRLYPANHALEEYQPSGQPSLYSRSPFRSWPIIIEGSDTGYNWQVANAAASREVHRLAALLSLAWDGCWAMREAPQERKHGATPVPERLWWEKPWDKYEVRPPTPENLPDWLNEAWGILDAEPAILDALLVYHEGLMLQREGRESFAMIAFVASIETIGAELQSLKRCPCCSKCTLTIGSAERFRKALALVISQKDRRKALADTIYGRRSTTAHAGRLHGTEAAPGTLVWAGSFFSVDSVWEFTRHLYETRNASRNILFRALRDGLTLSAD